MRKSHLFLALGAIVGVALLVGVCLDIGRAPQRPRRLSVSIVHLLANPGRYVGHEVIFCGYSAWTQGVFRVYLSRDDAVMWNSASSIIIDDQRISWDEFVAVVSPCEKNYVEVIGVFGPTRLGGTWGINSLESICEIYVPPKSGNADQAPGSVSQGGKKGAE